MKRVSKYLCTISKCKCILKNVNGRSFNFILEFFRLHGVVLHVSFGLSLWLSRCYRILLLFFTLDVYKMCTYQSLDYVKFYCGCPEKKPTPQHPPSRTSSPPQKKNPKTNAPPPQNIKKNQLYDVFGMDCLKKHLNLILSLVHCIIRFFSCELHNVLTRNLQHSPMKVLKVLTADLLYSFWWNKTDEHHLIE